MIWPSWSFSTQCLSLSFWNTYSSNSPQLHLLFLLGVLCWFFFFSNIWVSPHYNHLTSSFPILILLVIFSSLMVLNSTSLVTTWKFISPATTLPLNFRFFTWSLFPFGSLTDNPNLPNYKLQFLSLLQHTPNLLILQVSLFQLLLSPSFQIFRSEPWTEHGHFGNHSWLFFLSHPNTQSIWISCWHWYQKAARTWLLLTTSTGPTLVQCHHTQPGLLQQPHWVSFKPSNYTDPRTHNSVIPLLKISTQRKAKVCMSPKT